jgi:hypothetical protein
MPDPTSVCNEALGELGQAPIFSFHDDTSISTLCGQIYPTARDATLEMYPWNFATRRTWLARLAEPPAFGWSYAFGLPPDYLKARGTDHDHRSGGYMDFAIELDETGHRVLLSNQQRVGLLYTAHVDDLNLWSPLAEQVLVKVLAGRLAKAITGQGGTAELKLKEAIGLLAEARHSDGREGTPNILRIPPRLLASRLTQGGGPIRYPLTYTVNGQPWPHSQ